MLLILFWTALFVIGYTLILFPLCVVVRAVLLSKRCEANDITPSLSVIVAAYNEDKHIAQRIRNLLDCDYPPEHLEIIVASDGSTDATAKIVSELDVANVKLLDLPRGGKFKALNAACAVDTGEVLVFTDANTRFGETTLRNLVRPLADPTVGGVAGNGARRHFHGGFQ